MQQLIDFLESHGAATIPHVGGSLLAHLQRTAVQLRNWGASPELQALGLAHATYGTDGFPVQILDLEHRSELEAIVGPDVERQVYLYASCARGKTYPRLKDRPTVVFTDRFTETERELPAEELRSFAELTAANELDVALNATDFPHGRWLLGLLGEMSDLLSPAAWSDTRRILASS
jgi:hypothetical protein